MAKIIRVLFWVLAITAVSFSGAYAKDRYTDDFNARYGTSGGHNYQAVLGSCLTCHPSGSNRNSYANDWRNNGRNYAAVEGMDSDNDNFSNIAEINAGYFPGNSSSKPPAGNNPPVAVAGQDQTVNEGVSVTLDGSNSSDPDDGQLTYLWAQTGGTSVTLSDITAVQPTFVTPTLDAGSTAMTFRLTVEDNGGLQASANVSITVNDNGITGLPADVLTFQSFEGEPMGIKVESGGNITSLYPVDPNSIGDTIGKPENLIFGLNDLEIKADAPGATAVVTIHLPQPAPEDYEWYQYSSTQGWTNYSAGAVFNANRDQVTLTLTDGGTGDDDGMTNGVIIDPSGPGSPPPTVENCLTCHTPHGSTHVALLNGKTPYLCQRCHSNQGHAGELYARGASQASQLVYRVLNNKAFYRACLNGHTSVHGSNHSSGKTLLR